MRDRPTRSAVAALLGGVLWVVFAVGWLVTHGSTQSPRGNEILGLGATGFTALLAVPAALWAVSLGALPISGDSRGLTGRRVGRLLGQLGALAVALGAVAQTSIVDPNLNFSHPAVQGGWLLFIGGLVFGLSDGLAILAASWPGGSGVLRAGLVLAAVGSVLVVVAFFLSDASSGTPVWDAALAAMHGAPGVGWTIVGLALLRDEAPAVA